MAPIATNTPRAQILVSNTNSKKKNQGSLEKWPIPGMGQEIKELPEIKEALGGGNLTDWWQYIKRDKKMQASN